ncbi:hypothetical protein D9M72_375810 [compost metagenome]
MAAIVSDTDVHLFDIEEDLRTTERPVNERLLAAIGHRHHLIAYLTERNADIDAGFGQVFGECGGEGAVLALPIERDRASLGGKCDEQVG